MNDYDQGDVCLSPQVIDHRTLTRERRETSRPVAFSGLARPLLEREAYVHQVCECHV